jgi:hypothetical protein
MEKGKTDLELGRANWFERQLAANKKAEASLSGIGFAGCAPPRGLTLPPFGGILNL